VRLRAASLSAMPNRYLFFGKNLSRNDQESYLNGSVSFKHVFLDIVFYLCKRDITQPLKSVFSKGWQ
ncbi:hypothetical protein, partial [Sutterella wadsworthensis]|uniref:hypothetical protein n=1 Tax=Sutterella wadsworthensis TaxID=40545 RepID=UPI003966B3BB